MNTLDYAKSELQKYYGKVVGGECEIALINESYGHAFDDEIEIDVVHGVGSIKGSNERAVLIGVYKLFYELGCRFIRPGKDGEILVFCKKEDCTVKKSYKPKTRYRAVCSEGAISEQHVIDMVEWLPKVGMNSYFTQFVDGHLFFEKWYIHKASTVLPPEPYSSAQSALHLKNAVEAIKRCGLIYQAVGHGWTAEPLGYMTFGEHLSKDEDIKPAHRELFAEVKGARGFYRGRPSDTQLCYSKPEARAVVVEGIVDYLKANGTDVDILHCWLADSANNHCECEACQKRLPSEWYVTLLNELDQRLTEEKIDTKIVFLIYCDLLFAPKSVRLNNPDRFIMMYAPILRDYYDVLYTDENFAAATEAPQFVRNQNRHPKTGGEYLYYLREWQKVVNCDSFLFDYHLMTFQYDREPSFTFISKTIYEDMQGLGKAGLNGNVSCQLQRIFLPSSLPNYVMAETLFGTDRSFLQIEEECLSATYGAQYGKIRDLLHKTESFYTQKAMRGEAPIEDAVTEEYEAMLLRAKEELCFTDACATVELSLQNLLYFIEQQLLFARVLKKKIDGQDHKEEYAELIKFIDQNELALHSFEDSLFKKDGLRYWLGAP